MHDFEPSRLATHSHGMYLSFRSGDVIRVHVKDASGWWDGEVVEEIGGGKVRRGWFPSNYVREMSEGRDVSLGFWRCARVLMVQAGSGVQMDSAFMAGPRSAPLLRGHSTPDSFQSNLSSVDMHSRQISVLSQVSSASSAAPPPPLRQDGSVPNLSVNLQKLLKPILQSLSLLDAAIQANRKPHIQPSTACVISAIRTALEMTDCLSKESQILHRHPNLAKERKIVLVELSKLVACARAASGTNEGEADVTGDMADEEAMLEALAEAARSVLARIKRFLFLVQETGFRPMAQHSIASQDMTDRTGSSSSASEMLTTPPLTMPPGHASADRQASAARLRMQEIFKSRASSLGDLRGGPGRVRADVPPAPPTAGYIGGRGPSSASLFGGDITPVSSGFASTNSDQSSPVSFKDARSRTASAASPTSARPEAISTRQGRTGATMPLEDRSAQELSATAEIIENVNLAEDALLSIIAAFIGHIHSHSVDSHPSSHAHLIDMTRETIDSVREVLTVVESVGRQADLRALHPRDYENLITAKDALYRVATRLTESAERVASAPFSDTPEQSYDVEKAVLLQNATGTLRAGTECVRLVRLCAEEGLPNGVTSRQDTPRKPDPGAIVRRPLDIGVRGPHTLSGLARRATSLNHLQRRYLADGALVHPPDEADEIDVPVEEDDEVEVVAESGRDQDLRLQSGANAIVSNSSLSFTR